MARLSRGILCGKEVGLEEVQTVEIGLVCVCAQGGGFGNFLVAGGGTKDDASIARVGVERSGGAFFLGDVLMHFAQGFGHCGRCSRNAQVEELTLDECTLGLLWK